MFKYCSCTTLLPTSSQILFWYVWYIHENSWYLNSRLIVFKHSKLFHWIATYVTQLWVFSLYCLLSCTDQSHIFGFSSWVWYTQLPFTYPTHSTLESIQHIVLSLLCCRPKLKWLWGISLSFPALGDWMRWQLCHANIYITLLIYRPSPNLYWCQFESLQHFPC